MFTPPGPPAASRIGPDASATPPSIYILYIFSRKKKKKKRRLVRYLSDQLSPRGLSRVGVGSEGKTTLPLPKIPLRKNP